ncbi:MAG: hypothetical protein N2B58_01955, partial [Desulfobacterales bacterium]
MKKSLTIIAAALMLTAFGCQNNTEPKPEIKPAAEVKQEAPVIPATPTRPSDAELHAYKAYHHARYIVQTAEEAGGTNKLLHTKKLPT